MPQSKSEAVIRLNYSKGIMSEVNLTQQARDRVDELGGITLTFRLWGVTPSKQVAFEVFDRDMRGYLDLGIEYTEYHVGNIRAWIPSHHENIISGITVDYDSTWEEKYSQWGDDYPTDLTNEHRGFFCRGHDTDIAKILLTESECISVFNKLFFMQLNPPFMSHASIAAGELLEFLIKEQKKNRDEPCFSPNDLTKMIQYGFESGSPF